MEFVVERATCLHSFIKKNKGHFKISKRVRLDKISDHCKMFSSKQNKKFYLKYFFYNE